MKEKTWPAVEDALAEIKTQLSDDEAYLGKKLNGDAAGDSELAERVQHVLQLAVLMEETIDKVLAGLKEKKSGKPAFEVHQLEYTSHTIGTPDEAGAQEIEDLSFDKEETPEADETKAEAPEESDETTAEEDNAVPEETLTEAEEVEEEELRQLAAEEEEIAKSKEKKAKAKKDKEKKRKEKKDKKDKKSKKDKKEKKSKK